MGKKEQGRAGEGTTPLPSFGLAEDILGSGFLNGKEGAEGKEKDEGDVNRGLQDEGNGNRGLQDEDNVNRGLQDEGLMKYVTFFLEEEEYALPISQVQEIKRVGDITRVPNAPEHVRGVMNLRGRIVPVIELKKRLSLGEAMIDNDSRIVVVEQGRKVLGLMVDRVAQVLNMAAGQIEDAPEEVVQIQENYIKGVGKMDERMIILLDLEQIIGKEVAA
ncbi:MAG: chemotaxis protein CheW [bacterium]